MAKGESPARHALTRNVRGIVSCLFAAALALGMISSQAFAQPDEDTVFSGMKPLVSLDEQVARISGATGGLIPSAIDPALYGTGGAEPFSLDSNAGLPATYDLRSVNGKSHVTPVKSQDPWGLCWAFAGIASMESSAIKQGLSSADSTDFSERHMAWFYSHPLQTGSQAGEGTTLFSSENNVAITGASAKASAALVASGQGLELEETVPYKNNDDKMLDAMGKPVDAATGNQVCYSDAGDWSVPEEKRFNSVAQLKEFTFLPAPALSETAEGVKVYKDNSAEGTRAIKQALIDTGAVNIGYCADTSMPNETGSGAYFNYETWAQYTNTPLEADHAVSIVGWDDNYAVANFKEEVQPEHPGAWIVKNSWGADTPNVFPNKNSWGLGDTEDETGVHHGGTGYFYLSYYDQTISEAWSYELAAATENFDTTYQYDYLGLASLFDGTQVFSTPFSGANIFIAENDQVLEAASVQTTTPESTVTIQVYRLFDNAQNPTDGELLGTTEVTLDKGGYHRVALAGSSDDYALRKGEEFSVMETIKGKDAQGNDVYQIVLEVGYSTRFAESLSLPQWQNAVINSGESYCKDEDTWVDVESYNDSEGLEALDILFGNIMIKAFANDAQLPPVSEQTVSQVTNATTALSADTAAKAQVVGAITGANPSIALSDLPAQSPVLALFASSLAATDTLLATYDMSLAAVTSVSGPLQVSVPVGDAYNGKSAKVLHFVEAGKLDKTGVVALEDKVDIYPEVPVQNGVARITAYSLSPIGVALANSGPAPLPLGQNSLPVQDSIEGSALASTGDTLTIALFAFGVVAAGALCVVAVARRRDARQNS